jgi:hypothetical protein
LAADVHVLNAIDGRSSGVDGAGCLSAEALG